MTTESEAKLARYSATENEVDGFGRVIVVRRLRPSEQTKLAGMTAELTGSDEVTKPDGTKITIPHRTPLVIAASVSKIDESHIPFPRNRSELDAIYDRLDVEGLIAATKAAQRLDDTDAVRVLIDGALVNEVAEAKNL
jgi:hypothetical protein